MVSSCPLWELELNGDLNVFKYLSGCCAKFDLLQYQGVHSFLQINMKLRYSLIDSFLFSLACLLLDVEHKCIFCLYCHCKADDTRSSFLSNIAGQLWLMLASTGNQVRHRAYYWFKVSRYVEMCYPFLVGKWPSKIAQKVGPCIMSDEELVGSKGHLCWEHKYFFLLLQLWCANFVLPVWHRLWLSSHIELLACWMCTLWL